MDTLIAVQPAIQYVVFDKKTGRILQTQSRFSVEQNQDVEIPMEELKATLAKDPYVLQRLTDHDAGNLDILKSETKETGRGLHSPTMVDVKHMKIVAKPKLVLSAGKKEIVGDGQDSTEIEIKVVGATGRAVHTVDDQIKITTTRGRLSARAGIVDLVQGRATITLTSVNETVSEVRVRALSVSGACASGALTLEFV